MEMVSKSEAHTWRSGPRGARECSKATEGPVPRPTQWMSAELQLQVPAISSKI